MKGCFGSFPSVFFTLIQCCNIWGLAGILPLPHGRSFPSASPQGPPLVSRISSFRLTCCQLPRFPGFFYSRAPLDAFPSPERVSVFSWMGNFPIIGLRAGKRKGWGMQEGKGLGHHGGRLVLFSWQKSALSTCFSDFPVICSFCLLSSKHSWWPDALFWERASFLTAKTSFPFSS